MRSAGRSDAAAAAAALDTHWAVVVLACAGLPDSLAPFMDLGVTLARGPQVGGSPDERLALRPLTSFLGRGSLANARSRPADLRKREARTDALWPPMGSHRPTARFPTSSILPVSPTACRMRTFISPTWIAGSDLDCRAIERSTNG